MTKKDDDKKRLVKLGERRKKQAQHQLRQEEPWAAERWFEFVELFDPTKIVPISLKENLGQRMFLMGTLGDVVVVQVPSDSHAATVSHTLEALARRGIQAVAFSEDVRFVKLRACSAEEEALLTEADKDGDGLVQTKWPPQTATQATAGSTPVVIDRGGNVQDPVGLVSEAEAEAKGHAEDGGGDADRRLVSDHSNTELPSERFEREQREREESSDSEP